MSSTARRAREPWKRGSKVPTTTTNRNDQNVTNDMTIANWDMRKLIEKQSKMKCPCLNYKSARFSKCFLICSWTLVLVPSKPKWASRWSAPSFLARSKELTPWSVSGFSVKCSSCIWLLGSHVFGILNPCLQRIEFYLPSFEALVVKWWSTNCHISIVSHIQ